MRERGEAREEGGVQSTWVSPAMCLRILMAGFVHLSKLRGARVFYSRRPRVGESFLHPCAAVRAQSYDCDAAARMYYLVQSRESKRKLIR